MLEISTARHSHLCPRQILGVRIGIVGAAALGMEIPRRDKDLLIFVETDGCFADGVEVSTGCSMGHRTLRLEDVGKIAATFVNVPREEAVRVAPRFDVRERAHIYTPGEDRHYFAQLQAYQIMPADELLTVERVVLMRPIAEIISRHGVRVNCDRCGEEVINEREMIIEGRVLCRSCAGFSYYEPHPLAAITCQNQPL
ncbi:MAG: TraR/DksA C4-type zinc finger protein [Caldilineaceae bacterium]|nr:TraR/DksA C4-type zinc finger protein [Caldilineaceae bacterium]